MRENLGVIFKRSQILFKHSWHFYLDPFQCDEIATLQFEDSATRASAVKCAMGIVQRCMTGRHEGGMGLLLKELDML